MYIHKVCSHLPEISDDGIYRYVENPLSLNQSIFTNYIGSLDEFEHPDYIIVASSSLYLNPGKVDYKYIEEFLGRAGLGNIPSILICQNQCANAYYAMDIAEKMISSDGINNVLLVIFEWLGNIADRKMSSNEAVLSDGVGWCLLNNDSTSGYKIELIDNVVNRDIIFLSDPYQKAFTNIRAFNQIIERNGKLFENSKLLFPFFNRSTVEFLLTNKPHILKNYVDYSKYEGKHFLSLDFLIHMNRSDIQFAGLLFLLIGVGKFCLIRVSN